MASVLLILNELLEYLQNTESPVMGNSVMRDNFT